MADTNLEIKTSIQSDSNWNGIPVNQIYNTINNGSFAVILCFVTACIFGSRQVNKVVSSASWASLVGAIDRIRENQDLIKDIQEDTHQIMDDSKDLVELAKTLNARITEVGTLTQTQYTAISKELRSIKKLLEDKV